MSVSHYNDALARVNPPHCATPTSGKTFSDDALSHGVIIDNPVADGRIHRVPTTGKPKGKNGAYVLFEDGAGGWFQDHATMEQPQMWFSRSGENLSPAEHAERSESLRRLAASSAEERQARHDEVALDAEFDFNSANMDAGDHPYLIRKSVSTHGVRLAEDGRLMIPARDIDGKIWTLQLIDDDGEKRFLPDGRKSSAMHIIGQIDTQASALVILIAEGYATGATLHQATGLPAVVAFDTGNLEPVAKAIRGRYPAARIIICGDDDAKPDAAKNAGREFGEKTAKAVNGVAVFPDFGVSVEEKVAMKLSDFNDLAKQQGDEAVRSAIMAAVGGSLASDSQIAQVAVATEEPETHAEEDTDRAQAMWSPVSIASWPAIGRDGPSPCDVQNVHAVLTAAGMTVMRDAFSGNVFVERAGERVMVDDAACQRIWLMLHRSGLRASLSFTSDALTALSRERQFDTIAELFGGLPEWDGVTRAESILIDELGAEDSAYVRGATRLFFASLIRRGLGIEAKCDEMVILSGPQNIGKSTLFKRLIGEDLFQENLKLCHSTREVLELTQGKLIVEIAELSGMKRTDRDDVKTFFSTTTDEFSLKHEKHATKRRRRFVFIGTVNPEGAGVANLLEEDRRFLFIPVNRRADLDRVARDRMQILAEAVQIERAYGPILELHPSLREAARGERARARAVDPCDEALRELFCGIREGRVSVSDTYALIGARDLASIGRLTKKGGKGVAEVMESLGWSQTRIQRGGVRVRAFVRGEGGWIRAVWPHGANAPAEIGVDEEHSPGWSIPYDG